MSDKNEVLSQEEIDELLGAIGCAKNIQSLKKEPAKSKS